MIGATFQAANAAGSSTQYIQFTVTAAPPLITPVIAWPSQTVPYGQPLDGTQLDATATDPQTGATIPGTFAYSPPAGTVLNIGTPIIGVTFTPSDTTTYSATQDLTTEYVVPLTASITGQGWALRQQAATWTISLTNPAPVNVASGFVFTVNWGDGSNVQIFTGESGIQITHTYTTLGTDTMSVTVQGAASGSASQAITQSVSVIGYHNWYDPANPSLYDLVWGGGNGSNSVRFVQTGPTSVQAIESVDNGMTTNTTLNFVGVTGSVVVLGGPSNDVLDVSGLTSIPATVNGGGGNNTLYGGGGNETLIGGSDGAEGGSSHPDGSNTIVAGSGNDLIYGNGLTARKDEVGGNNLIIGGGGNDTIYGNYGPGGDGGEGGQNLIVTGSGGGTVYTSGGVDGAEGGHGSIVVAGTTNLSPAALAAILAEWTSADPLATKVADIEGTNGTAGLNGANYSTPGNTVVNNNSVNTIFSDAHGSADWLLDTFSQDETNDSKPTDILANLV